MASNIFLDIVQGKARALIVHESDNTLAFLDHRPLLHGHVLLIPKEHYITVFDIPDDLLAKLMKEAKMLSIAVQKAMGSQGIFIGINNVVSQSVPLLHIHIVPRNKGDGLKGFFWPRNPYRDEEHAREVQVKIKKALASL